jgi:hypothetical protein
MEELSKLVKVGFSFVFEKRVRHCGEESKKGGLWACCDIPHCTTTILPATSLWDQIWTPGESPSIPYICCYSN